MIARVAVLLVCTVAACRSGKTTMTGDDSVVKQMRQQLAAARAQTAHAATADTIPERAAVRSLVASHPGERWSALTDDERFLLYELSDDARAAAAPAEVARAYCAGLRIVPHEWWGDPDAVTRAPARRLVALGADAARCLRPLLDATEPLIYRRGETNALVKQLGWTLGDLAAALAAALVAAPYDVMTPADARAAQRAELARALDAMTSRK